MHIYKSINIVGFDSAVFQISHKLWNTEVNLGAVREESNVFQMFEF